MKDLEQFDLPTGSFGYSATDLDDLGASQYTLVTIVNDVSGSVTPYKKDMEKAIKEIISSCKDSPRKDFLMIRLISFCEYINEIHGFKLLSDCNIDDYDDCLKIGNTTALYDAANNSIEAMYDYSKKLTQNDYDVNGIVFIITDGLDNCSNQSSPKDINDTLNKMIKEESLESLITILIGVGIQAYPEIGQTLSEFKDKAGFTEFIDIGDASAKTLAKLADFVSKSISAQSQAIGSGGASKSLIF